MPNNVTMAPGHKLLLDRLLDARRALLTAEAARANARVVYVAAEKAYLDSLIKASPHEQPFNVVVGNVLVMPKDEWYDCGEGERLEYHTVEIATEIQGEQHG